MKHPPSFYRAISAFVFEFPLDRLIIGLKQQRQYHWARELSEPLALRIKQEYDAHLPDLIVSVPIHWTRRLKRGFNQSSLIAECLSQSLKIPHCDALRKLKRTQTQRALKKKQRLHNLKISFQCRSTVRNLHIALVDDVITTGATAETATQALLKQGAQRVDIWSLARTPEPGK